MKAKVVVALWLACGVVDYPLIKHRMQSIAREMWGDLYSKRPGGDWTRGDQMYASVLSLMIGPVGLLMNGAMEAGERLPIDWEAPAKW